MTSTPEPLNDDSAPGTAGPVGCPFCALACDDLSLPMDNQAQRLDCPRARLGFGLALAHTEAAPTIDGKTAEWAAAIGAARDLMAGAHLPLFHGLLGDLADARAAWSMAARFGGVVDHRDGDGIARNLALYQDSGWITTSLGEARNRADLVVWVGTPTHDELPRLREKLFDCPDRLHAEGPPTVVELGAWPRDEIDQVRTLLGGRPLPAAGTGALRLLEQLRAARYSVFLVGELDATQADTALRAASGLVRDLNERQRAALLLIGQGPGDITAQLSGTWHNGFGIRTSLARGYPEQDLMRFAARRLLDEGQADLLVWISSLDASPPPPSRQPQVVFGHPATRFGDAPPAVFLPVAVPGVHRAGFIHRGDALRLVPLFALTGSTLPGTSALCARVLDAGAAAPC